MRLEEKLGDVMILIACVVMVVVIIRTHLVIIRAHRNESAGGWSYREERIEFTDHEAVARWVKPKWADQVTVQAVGGAGGTHEHPAGWSGRVIVTASAGQSANFCREPFFLSKPADGRRSPPAGSPAGSS